MVFTIFQNEWCGISEKNVSLYDTINKNNTKLMNTIHLLLFNGNLFFKPK